MSIWTHDTFFGILEPAVRALGLITQESDISWTSVKLNRSAVTARDQMLCRLSLFRVCLFWGIREDFCSLLNPCDFWMGCAGRLLRFWSDTEEFWVKWIWADYRLTFQSSFAATAEFMEMRLFVPKACPGSHVWDDHITTGRENCLWS